MTNLVSTTANENTNTEVRLEPHQPNVAPSLKTPITEAPKNKQETNQNETNKKTIPIRTWIKISAAGLLATLLALYFFRNVLIGTPTDVYAVTSGEMLQSVVASGRVISPQRITIALQGSGRVLRVAVAEGQTVKSGQVLIELDNSDSRASLAQANAAVAQAQAKLRQLGELSQPLALQTLAQAQAGALQARKTLARNRDLVARGFVSQAAVDDAQRAVDVANSQVTSAQAQVKTNTAGGSDTLLAEAALRQALAGAGQTRSGSGACTKQRCADFAKRRSWRYCPTWQSLDGVSFQRRDAGFDSD